MTNRPTVDSVAEFIAVSGGQIMTIAIRAVIIMFVAAAVTKRFDVFAAVGYVESLAWSAGYGLVRGMFHPEEEE